MRVHPILDWTYDEIWDFLRHTNLTLGDGTIEWCELYDYGCVSTPGSLSESLADPLQYRRAVTPLSARLTTPFPTLCCELPTIRVYWEAGDLHGSSGTRRRKGPVGEFGFGRLDRQWLTILHLQRGQGQRRARHVGQGACCMER